MTGENVANLSPLEKTAVAGGSVALANKVVRNTHTVVTAASEMLASSAGNVAKGLTTTVAVLKPFAEVGTKAKNPLTIGLAGVLVADKVIKGDNKGAAVVGVAAAAGLAAGIKAGAAATLFAAPLGPAAPVVGVIVGTVVGGLAAYAAGKATEKSLDVAFPERPKAPAADAAKKAPAPVVAQKLEVPAPSVPQPQKQVDKAHDAPHVPTKEEVAKQAAQNLFKSHPSINDAVVSVVDIKGHSTSAKHVSPKGVTPADKAKGADKAKIGDAIAQAQKDACEVTGTARVAVKYGIVETQGAQPTQHSSSLPCPEKGPRTKH